jgi:hypothetical protein
VDWEHILFTTTSQRATSQERNVFKNNCPMKISLLKVNILLTHTQIMLMTLPTLVCGQSINWRKKYLKTPPHSLKNACYFLINDDVILLRKMSWPISGLFS